MHVLVVGASGRAGSRVATELLDAGHDVTAFVRHADRLPAAVRDRCRGVVEGDVTDRSSLAGGPPPKSSRRLWRGMIDESSFDGGPDR